MFTQLQQRICKRIYTVVIHTTDFNSKCDKMARYGETDGLYGFLWFRAGSDQNKFVINQNDIYPEDLMFFHP